MFEYKLVFTRDLHEHDGHEGPCDIVKKGENCLSYSFGIGH